MLCLRKILGVDLSGKDGNPTGITLILDNDLVVMTIFRTLNTIKEYIATLKPDIIAIDSPLNFPRGRVAYRDCDLELKKVGINPLPLNMSSMKMLIERAKSLVSFAHKMGIQVIETFPYGSLRLLGYKRKPRSIKERRRIIRSVARIYGVKLRWVLEGVTKDEFDSFLCGLVGKAVLDGSGFVVFGESCRIFLLSGL